MPSRIWLAVAFALAFGATPAHAQTHESAVLHNEDARLFSGGDPHGAATIAHDDDTGPIGEARGRESSAA